MMGLIEEALRETFAAQVRTAPVVDDAAGRAIEAAGRARRRRAVVGALAIAASVAFVAGGVAMATRPSAQRAADERTATGPAPQRPVDVRTPTAILTGDGRVISLAQLPTVTDALRVDGGWLVTTTGTRWRSLYHVGDDGDTTWLTDGDRIVVASDGRWVARSIQGGVSVGERTGRKLIMNQHTGGTGTLEPIAFAGGGLVLGVTEATRSQSDVWFPARGEYVPGPGSGARVVAATADGTQVFALVGSPYPCLEVLSPVGLATVRRACELYLKANPTLVPSPDGRWLLALGPDRIDLYDLDAVWRVHVPIASWTVVAQHVAWVDGSQFVLNGHGELLRGYVDAPDRLDEIAVDAGADGDVVPIPVARP